MAAAWVVGVGAMAQLSGIWRADSRESMIFALSDGCASTYSKHLELVVASAPEVAKLLVWPTHLSADYPLASADEAPHRLKVIVALVSVLAILLLRNVPSYVRPQWNSASPGCSFPGCPCRTSFQPRDFSSPTDTSTCHPGASASVPDGFSQRCGLEREMPASGGSPRGQCPPSWLSGAER